MTLYNSELVLSAVRSKVEAAHPEERDKISRIAGAVDDYAQTQRGKAATDNLLLCGGDGEQETFREGAKAYVQSEVYGSGIVSFLAWMAFRWLVMKIIDEFIETLMKQEQ